MFSFIYAWINDWVNNREAGDLRRQRGHYDVIVMKNICYVMWAFRYLFDSAVVTIAAQMITTLVNKTPVIHIQNENNYFSHLNSNYFDTILIADFSSNFLAHRVLAIVLNSTWDTLLWLRFP